MADPRYALFAARAVFDPRLTATDVRVLAALGTYTNKQGWCFPKQETVALRIGIKRPTVVVAIKRLVECGYLEQQAQTAPGRGRTMSKYRVKLDIEDPMSADITSGADVTPADVGPDNIGGADVSVHRDPMSAQADSHREHSQVNGLVVSPAPVRDEAWKGLWAGRLKEAQARAGSALNMTHADAHHFAAFLPLCEPTMGEPCDWEFDVLPAIDKLAASFGARSRQFYSWKLVREHAIENRDARSAGLPAPVAPTERRPATSNRRPSMATVVSRMRAEGKLT